MRFLKILYYFVKKRIITWHLQKRIIVYVMERLFFMEKAV